MLGDAKEIGMYKEHIKTTLTSVALCIVLVTLLAPFAMITTEAFTDRAFLGSVDHGWSHQWFVQLLHSKRWSTAAILSLLVILTSTAGAVVVGVYAAWVFFRWGGLYRFIAYFMYGAPLVIPPIVLALGIRTMLWDIVPPIFLIILANGIEGLAVVFIIVSGALNRIRPSEIQAAELLASSWWRVLTDVVLPHCWPAILAATMLTAFLAFDDVVFAVFLGDSTTRTFSRLVWEVARQDASPMSAAASTAWMVLVLVGIILIIKTQRGIQWLSKASNDGIHRRS